MIKFLPNIITPEEAELLKNINIDKNKRDNDHPLILKIRNVIDEAIKNPPKFWHGANWDSPSYIRTERHGKHGWHVDTGGEYGTKGHMEWCDFGCSILLTDDEKAGYLEYRNGNKLLPKEHYCGLAIHSSDVEHRVVDATIERHTLLSFVQRKL